MTSVWYIGTSDSRVIDSEDWENSGLGDDLPAAVWNKANGYSITSGFFTLDQLAFLAGQSDFDTVAPDGPRDPEWVPPVTPPVYPATNQVFGEDGRFLEAKLPPRLSPEGLNNTVAAGVSAASPQPIDLTDPVSGFDAARHVYNQNQSSFPRLRAAMAKAIGGTGLCRIGFAADSKTAGQSTTDRSKDAWPSRMREFLRAAGVPIAGTGIVYCNAESAGIDPRWTFVGWATPVANAHLRSSTTPGTTTATFVSDLPGEVVEILCAGGAIDVTVDGGSPATIVPDSSSALGIKTITGLPNTVHTVVITPSTSTQAFVAGAGVRHASGVLVDNAAISGTTTAQWGDATWYSPGLSLNASAPAAVFIALMTNDWATAVATFKTRYEAVAARFPNSDIIAVATGPSGSGGIGPALPALREAVYELADAHGWPLLDFWDREISWISAFDRGLMTDGEHENTAGHADLGLVASRLIVP